MARFIEVTDGIWINTSYITKIVPDPNDHRLCIVYTTDGSGYILTAQARDIARKADDAG